MPGKRPVIVTRTAADVVAIARLLGHADVSVFRTPTGSKWMADCACGWHSTGMVRQEEALSGARYHLTNAVKQFDRAARAAGLSLNAALTEAALSEDELRDLDEIVRHRMEERSVSNW